MKSQYNAPMTYTSEITELSEIARTFQVFQVFGFSSDIFFLKNILLYKL